MEIIKEIKELRAKLGAQRDLGQKVGFVPTMGALHQGHLSLVELAKQKSDFVVMSIFVNPTQFNSSDDLAKYPRTLEQDCLAAEGAGVSLVFAPTERVIYPEVDGNKRAWIKAGSAATGLEGSDRPGHFDGVATVVAALFLMVQPDVAVFGEKDFQQVCVIRQLINTLHFPVELVVGPIVREEDGLAMSSRNVRLSFEGRKKACNIFRVLRAVKERCSKESFDVQEIEREVFSLLSSEDLKPYYASIRDPQDFSPLSGEVSEGQLLVAVSVEGVRLIDNIRLERAL